MTFTQSNLEEILIPLRVHIGDTTEPYTYTDELLHNILRHAVNALMPRWSNRYYLDNDGVALRNTGTGVTFDFSSPPVIQRQDNRPIVLQAAIMIKSGSKFSSVSSAVSWRDEEISYSNIESAKQRSSALQDDVDELNMLLPKKLARPAYGRLYGQTKDWE